MAASVGGHGEIGIAIGSWTGDYGVTSTRFTPFGCVRPFQMAFA